MCNNMLVNDNTNEKRKKKEEKKLFAFNMSNKTKQPMVEYAFDVCSFTIKITKQLNGGNGLREMAIAHILLACVFSFLFRISFFSFLLFSDVKYDKRTATKP